MVKDLLKENIVNYSKTDEEKIVILLIHWIAWKMPTLGTFSTLKYY